MIRCKYCKKVIELTDQGWVDREVTYSRCEPSLVYKNPITGLEREDVYKWHVPDEASQIRQILERYAVQH